MAGTGGRRAGAGRPKAPHTVQAEAAKKELIRLFLLKKLPIFNKLIEQAEAGDNAARKELLERVWGKVPNQLADEEGNPIAPFQIIINKLNGKD